MKDILSFPIVGTAYCNPSSIQDLEEGMILQLVSEPENIYDSDAVKVLYNGIHVGYVPNRGFTCTNCWMYFPSKAAYCSCGASWDQVIAGGLATRLTKTKALLRSYACLVATVDNTSYVPKVTVKLVLE